MQEREIINDDGRLADGRGSVVAALSQVKAHGENARLRGGAMTGKRWLFVALPLAVSWLFVATAAAWGAEQLPDAASGPAKHPSASITKGQESLPERAAHLGLYGLGAQVTIATRHKSALTTKVEEALAARAAPLGRFGLGAVATIAKRHKSELSTKVEEALAARAAPLRRYGLGAVATVAKKRGHPRAVHIGALTYPRDLGVVVTVVP